MIVAPTTRMPFALIRRTIAPGDAADSTSIAFTHHSDVIVAENGVRLSSAETSPLPSALRYEVVAAAVCWLGLTPPPGTKRLIARSCCARTGNAIGSLH